MDAIDRFDVDCICRIAQEVCVAQASLMACWQAVVMKLPIAYLPEGDCS